VKKIPTVLVRNPDDRAHVLDEVTPGCEWVLNGMGIATRKIDGTCMMFDENARWWARREVKPGKPTPDNFVPVEYDEVTGKTFGWEPVEQSGFARWHAEATAYSFPIRQGTYELIGPKINGNPECRPRHELIHHTYELNGLRIEGFVSHTVDEIKSIVRAYGERGWEGIVWQNPDGRMAKLKAHDLGGVG
jgi:hypothetical protein